MVETLRLLEVRIGSPRVQQKRLVTRRQNRPQGSGVIIAMDRDKRWDRTKTRGACPCVGEMGSQRFRVREEAVR